MYLKKWILGEKEENKGLEKIQGYSTIINKILINRGLTSQEDIDDFIHDKVSQDPFKLKDMEKAVNRINQAIEKKEKIVIYGDYDVDGITSTVVLYLYLKDKGAKVEYYIPSREKEGYGLNIDSIDKLKDNCQLLITVDNGITAIEEIDYANGLGIDVIVTDHHKPLSRLPEAEAVIDPHREDCDSGCEILAGVGVVYKLISALEGNCEKILEDYGDIICLGTIVDVMPLIGENRLIVKAGFKKMSERPNLGIKALMDVTRVNGNNITAVMVSYRLAPRLNSASRLDKVDLALDLLLSEDYDEAMTIAKKLDMINSERKKLEKRMLEDIEKMILENPELVTKEDIIILINKGWNHSIAGINASKIVEKYYKPCLIISMDETVANGSGRSIEGVSMIDIIDESREYLIKYGGHKGAAGFTLKSEDVDKFRAKVVETARGLIKEIPIKSYRVDCEIDSSDVTVENIGDLKLLEPYGFGNEMPLVMIKKAHIKGIISLSEGKYTKVVAEFNNGYRLEFLLFDIAYKDFIYEVGDIVDVLVTLELNEYRNVVSPALTVRDIRLTEFDQEKYFKEVEIYNRTVEGKEIKDLLDNREEMKEIMPTKKEMGMIYRYLINNREIRYIDKKQLREYLFIKLLRYGLRYIKVGLILDILQEIGVILIKSEIEIPDIKGKVDINMSKTYQRLQLIDKEMAFN